MQIAPINVHGAATVPANREDAKLRKACQGFEALLVQQMLSAMRQTVEKSDVFGSREKEDVFQGMLDQQMADEISRTGTMGIADMLYAQLSKINEQKTDSGPGSR